MNKKINKVFIILLILFSLNAKSAFALTCSEIEDEIKNYESIKTELENVDCTKDTDASIVNKCNDLYLKKSLSISNLYRMKENKVECTGQKDKIGIILEDNKDNCSLISDGFIEDLTKKVMLIFYIIGPILVIIFGSLDYTKAVVDSNPNALKKATNNFIKRLAAVGLLFLSPAIVNIIINMNVSDYILSGDGYTCKTNHINLSRTYTVEYVSPSTSSPSGGGGGGASFSSSGVSVSDSSNSKKSNVRGDYLSWLQYDSKWGGNYIGSKTIGQVGCFATSIAIQIANSGTAKSSNFDPGVLVSSMKANGGFSGNVLQWKDSWTAVAPKFQSVSWNEQLSGNLTQKTKMLKKQIDKGYYPVVQVKDGTSGSSHYVAIIAIKNNKIVMADPASNKTTLNCSTYPRFCVGTKQMALFKVK